MHCHTVLDGDPAPHSSPSPLNRRISEDQATESMEARHVAGSVVLYSTMPKIVIVA